MSKTADVHPVQAKILRELLFKTSARFSELNISKLSNDHFTFHINKLIELSLIEKSSGQYQLTIIGKEFANRMDTDKAVIERQAKICVLLVCVKKIGKTKKYLIQQRLKQPYFGYWGFPGGKIRWGETLEEAAIRELEEETGLSAKLQLVGIRHKMDYSENGDLLEDKYFYAFRCNKAQGTLKEEFEGGKNIWLAKKEILKLPTLFDAVRESMESTDNKHLQFYEAKYNVSGY